MALGSLRKSQQAQPMAEINTTPLVDVMLVLFIIVLVTAPILTHTVALELPRELTETTSTSQQPNILSIDAAGELYWNNERSSREQLVSHFAKTAMQNKDQPIELYIDKAVPYGNFSWVLIEAQENGLTKLGFALEVGH